MVAVVWQFETRPEQAEAFERFYGADGEWTRLSRRSRSFLGSSFLKDLASDHRYLLVEYWSEMLVYERHLADVAPSGKSSKTERDRFVARWSRSASSARSTCRNASVRPGPGGPADRRSGGVRWARHAKSRTGRAVAQPGDPGGDRTHDPVIKSHMLYH